MKNVVAYCRVSTDGQASDDKFGIESQKEQIIDYCAKNEMQILNWYIDEGISGVKDERPEFDKILYGDNENDEVINPPIEAVVVAKSDRIARDINLYFYFKMLLKKNNVELISVSEDFGQLGAFAPMLEAFTMFVAEQERMNITKRTSNGRKIKAIRGGYSGGRSPFGYKVLAGELIVDKEEAEIVKLIFEMLNSGEAMLAVANKLNEMGYKTRKGGKFYASNISSIKGNKKLYEGFYKYGKEMDWVKGIHEPILKSE